MYPAGTQGNINARWTQSHFAKILQHLPQHTSPGKSTGYVSPSHSSHTEHFTQEL